MRYAEQIKGLRLRLVLNQKQFAEKLGVSQGTVSRWESGSQEPSEDVLKKMSVLGSFERSDFVRDLKSAFSPEDQGRDIFIKGQVALNRLVEEIEWSQDHWIKMRIPEVPAWNNLNISAYLVSDFSDDVYTENSVVFVVPFEINQIEPKSGDKILFSEKHERSGRFELFIARFQEHFDDNRVMLKSSGLSMDFRQQLSDILAFSGGFREAGFIGLVVGGMIIESVDRISSRARFRSHIRDGE